MEEVYQLEGICARPLTVYDYTQTRILPGIAITLVDQNGMFVDNGNNK
jgi:hypothetical protein